MLDPKELALTPVLLRAAKLFTQDGFSFKLNTMRAMILYHPRTEQEGIVESYVHDFKRFKGKDLEKVSLDTVEGAHIAELYDVMRYPAILVIGPDGALQKAWESPIMPLMDEVDSYIHNSETDFARARLLSV